MKVSRLMTKDYSELMNLSPGSTPKPTTVSKIIQYGWQPFFSQQVSIDDLNATPPVRVTEVHRSGFHVIGDAFESMIPPGADATVGDWLMLDQDLPHASRVLDRKSLFKRRAPGSDRRLQLIAANIDTCLIVTSCNDDFNIARLERYIALALEAEVDPVIVITKSDLTDTPQDYLEPAQAISEAVPVILMDARTDQPAEKLKDWCKPGQTLAFMGSSGVGKSTLVNALSGQEAMATSGIREDDAKGRHTTTHRHLHLLSNGCTVLDTPGMRELQMTDVASGIDNLFSDLAELEASCKFKDCAHETEPGCAVLAAIDAGQIELQRVKRWKKLAAEDRFNSASLAERRAQDKAFGKKVRAIMKDKKR